MRSLVVLCRIVITAPFVAGLALAAWPVADSDLPQDPAVHFGLLPNGVRFAIRPNAEPKDRIYIRLLVAAGSLHERDYERGIAHFVEHMAFRGTRRNPGDSLARELAQLGIGFGADSTAFTGYDSTSFHLDLPNSNDAMLRRGLDVLRDYASEIAFAPGQIERERGVILNEKAMRDNASGRLNAAQLQFLFPAAREVRRPPIGVDESIRNFTRQQLVDFYDAWYRPERIAVIIVGNVSQPLAESLVTEIFGSLRARAPARDDPVDLKTAASSAPAIRLWFDHGIAGTEISLQHALPDPPGADSQARRVREVHRALAVRILQRRLNRLAQSEAGVFVAPIASLTAPLPGWLVVGLKIAGPASSWKSFAAAIEQEHRRALVYGFAATEVSTAAAALRENYEQAARTAATRPSQQVANGIEQALLRGRIFATPAAVRDDLVPALARATPRDCVAAFRELWGQSSPHIFFAGHPDFHIRSEEIAEIVTASRAVTVERAVAPTPISFAYADPGPAGTLAKDDIVPDLDLHLATFANGARVNFKSTAFEAESVLVRVRVGDGQGSQPRDQPGLNLLAAQALTGGGVQLHSVEQLREILAGQGINIGFDVEADACVFTARCSRSDLALCLRVISAYLDDAAYRPIALRNAHANFGSMYAKLAESSAGNVMFRVERTLVPDDRRFGIPEINETFARSLAELSKWLEPQFKKGPIEIAIVGDITWPDAVDAVSRSLGALASREPRATAAATTVTFAQQATTPYVISTNTGLTQAAIAWVWPVPDRSDIQTFRRANFLAASLAERIRLRLRDELGVAYAPNATYVLREGVDSFAYFLVSAEIAADQIVPAAAAIKSEVESIRSHGFSDDEFARVRQPFLRQRVDDLRTNAYWCYTVLDDAQQRPERLAAARNRITDSAAITRAEIEALARRYLDPAAGFMFVSEPGIPHLWGRK